MLADHGNDDERPPQARASAGRTLRRAAGWLAALYAAIALPVFLGTPAAASVVLATVLLGVSLVALSAIDLETLRLPDVITLPLAAAGLILAQAFDWPPNLYWRIGAMGGGFVSLWLVARGYEAWRGRSGLGLGDAKLLAAAGAWTGPDGVPATLLYACAGALIYAGVRHLAGKPLARDEPFAFGPFIAAGLWLVWCYGPVL